MKTFEELGVSPEILKAIKEMGYENPMPVQEEVIPYLLGNGNDVVALAQTGTGKTAAFGLPLIQKIEVKKRVPQALILCPTRELCLQIAGDLNDYSKYIDGLKVLPVYGGSSIESQIRMLKAGVHIIVATPGRLIDLMERKVAKLETIADVVMDEADEMLNMGFTDSINAILEKVPEDRNTLMFSATMSPEISRIAKKYLHDAKEITIGTKNEGSKNVNHIAYLVHAKDKYAALVREVKRLYETGQPVLVGTIAVETSEVISQLLNKEHIPHEVLNAKNHAREAEIIAKAGRPKSVTIATNMAGRGTDIKLTEESRKLGGLAVLGSERHESRRIDNQLRGRSGRQGDPGFSRFYVSLEDSLMVRFGGDKLQKLFEKMGDEQIESKAVTKSITMAQKRVEGYNFDMRKQLLDYDDVLRRQREIIYAQRNRILEADEVHDMVHVVFEKTIEQTLQANLSDQKKQTIDVAGVVKSIEMMGMAEDKAIHASELEGKSYDEVKEYCVNKIWNEYEAEIKDVKRQFLPFEKTVVLRNIDRNWINHIDMMDKLRSGIYLRSYAQNNPLQQYVQEGFDMFEEMNQRIDREITFFLLKVRIRKEHAA